MPRKATNTAKPAALDAGMVVPTAPGASAPVATRDYASQGPFAGDLDGSFGIIPCTFKCRPNRMVDVVHRRLVQFGRPMVEPLAPTCTVR